MPICHDARYDGENMSFYDYSGKCILSHRARLFRGLPNVVNESGGKHILEVSDTESIVINPNPTSRLAIAEGKNWYVKNRVMKDLDFVIFTEWIPMYVTDEMYREVVVTNAIPTKERVAACLPAATTNVYYIVPSIKSPMYMNHYEEISIVPLLETLIHTEPSWSGLTLSQIACTIEGCFRPEFSDEAILMEILFGHSRDLCANLCRTESVPLHKLYQCDFNVTFEHSLQKIIYEYRITVVKCLKNVVMVPLSRLLHEKAYGNIPWLIKDMSERKSIEEKACFITQDLGFFNEGQFTGITGSVVFTNVCILPEILVEEDDNHLRRLYPAGSMIGVAVYGDKSCDIMMRGELFEEITTREQIILTLMFNAFIDKQLSSTIDCTKFARNIKLDKDQSRVRKSFINAIQNQLFLAR